MISQGVVRWDEQTNRYYQSQSQLVIHGMGESDFVRQYFRESLSEVGKWAVSEFRSENRLFSNSVFSVDSARLPEFKNQLRELIERFVDQTEDPQGDSLGRILVAFGRL